MVVLVRFLLLSIYPSVAYLQLAKIPTLYAHPSAELLLSNSSPSEVGARRKINSDFYS